MIAEVQRLSPSTQRPLSSHLIAARSINTSAPLSQAGFRGVSVEPGPAQHRWWHLIVLQIGCALPAAASAIPDGLRVVAHRVGSPFAFSSAALTQRGSRHRASPMLFRAPDIPSRRPMKVRSVIPRRLVGEAKEPALGAGTIEAGAGGVGDGHRPSVAGARDDQVVPAVTAEVVHPHKRAAAPV